MNLQAIFNRTLFWRLLISLCVANSLILVLGTSLAERFISLREEQGVNWSALAQAANDAYVKGGEDGLKTWVHDQREEGIDAALYQNGESIVRENLPRDVRRSISRWISDGHDVEQNPDSGYFIAFKEIPGSNPARQFIAATNPRGRTSRHTKEHILFLVQALLSLVFIGIIGWWTARSVSHPIEAMRKAAQQMAGGDFSARIPERWSSQRNEFGELSRDFNTMAERIGTLIDHERSILQDLSHELRSPLARLLASLHLTRHQDPTPIALQHIGRAEEEVARMDHITSEMLALSRMEADLPGMEREWIDVATLTMRRVEAAQWDAAKRAVRFELSYEGAPCILGSEILLERVLDNLLDNAVKFSPDNGVVDVSVRDVGGQTELRIADRGPGVRQEEIEKLFRPFYRGGNAPLATGHGLGLNIVKRVVELHGGHIALQNVAPTGLEVTLRFPGKS